MTTLKVQIAKLSVVTGNWYDSRIGNHSYSQWTTGYDTIVSNGEKTMAFSVESHTMRGTLVTSIDVPTDRTEFSEGTWQSLPTQIRKTTFMELLEGVTEDDWTIFANGEEQGRKILEAKAFLQTVDPFFTEWTYGKQRADEELNLELALEIGAWESIGETFDHKKHGEGTWTASRPFYGKDGKVYLVSYGQGRSSAQDGFRLYNNYSVKAIYDTVADFDASRQAVANDKKAYARKCGWLSRKYRVPFGQAIVFFGHNEVLYREYREKMDAAKTKVDALSYEECEYWAKELCCGRSRNSAALSHFGVMYFGDSNYFDKSELIESIEAHQATLPEPIGTKKRSHQVEIPEIVAHATTLGDMCPELANL